MTAIGDPAVTYRRFIVGARRAPPEDVGGMRVDISIARSTAVDGATLPATRNQGISGSVRCQAPTDRAAPPPGSPAELPENSPMGISGWLDHKRTEAPARLRTGRPSAPGSGYWRQRR
jgi:hypothetical protein